MSDTTNTQEKDHSVVKQDTNSADGSSVNSVVGPSVDPAEGSIADDANIGDATRIPVCLLIQILLTWIKGIGKNLIIQFVGISGSGKTTTADTFRKYLKVLYLNQDTQGKGWKNKMYTEFGKDTSIRVTVIDRNNFLLQDQDRVETLHGADDNIIISLLFYPDVDKCVARAFGREHPGKGNGSQLCGKSGKGQGMSRQKINKIISCQKNTLNNLLKTKEKIAGSLIELPENFNPHRDEDFLFLVKEMVAIIHNSLEEDL